MTTTADGVVHYTCTRLALVEALRNLPLTEQMTREALVKMADAILGQLPEASGAAFYMEGVKAERERIAELAEEHARRVGDEALPVEGDRWTRVTAAEAIRGAWLSAATLIREQP